MYALVMDKLDISLQNLVYRNPSNASRYTVDIFIKTRASVLCFYPSYSLDVPGPSIVVPVPHEDFLAVLFGCGLV